MIHSIWFSGIYILFFCFLFISFLHSKINRSISISIGAVVVVALIFFIGFKGYLYGDWIIYKQMFLKAPALQDGFQAVNYYLWHGNFSSIEKGFLIWCVICKSFFSDFFIFQTISFLVDLSVFLFFFNKLLDDNWILGLLFFYLFGLFSLELVYLRNAKAVCLFVISIKYIQKKQPFQYFFLNIIGCFFHMSSMIFLPLYFILGRVFSRRVIFFLFILGNLLYLTQFSITRSLFVYISNTFDIPKLKFYLDNKSYGVSNGITIGFLERFLSFYIFYKFYFKVELRYKEVIYNCYYIYMILNLYFFDFYIISGRFGSIFVLSYWFLYPCVYQKMSKQQKVVFLFFVACYGILKIFTLTNQPWTSYNNYLFNPISDIEMLNNVKNSSI